MYEHNAKLLNVLIREAAHVWYMAWNVHWKITSMHYPS